MIPLALLTRTMALAKIQPSMVVSAPSDLIANRNADLTPSVLTEKPTLTALELKTPTLSAYAAITDAEATVALRDAARVVTNAEAPMRL